MARSKQRYGKISLKVEVLDRYSKLIEALPQLGFKSLADFLTRAGHEYATQLELRFGLTDRSEPAERRRKR